MKWIRVEDKLPDYDVPVLVYCRIYGRYITSRSRIHEYYDAGNWYSSDGKKGGLPPTHWMPLPDAPNE